ncbi:MAG: hypothetical protein K6B14_05495 [Lachnospiraceae bacterium]|nr:hypothetical protein [Lachnospiraceae bacterium]
MITLIGVLIFALWASAIAFMLVRIEGYSKTDVILKTTATACIVLIAILANVLNARLYDNPPVAGETVFRFMIVIGLVFGMVGDLTLGLSHINKDKKVMLMFAGIISFGLNHVCNIIAIMKISYVADKKYILYALAGAVFMALIVAFGGRKLGFHFGRYTGILSGYAGLLSMDSFLAIGLWRGTKVAIEAAEAAYNEAGAATGYYDPAMLPSLAYVLLPVFVCLAAGQLAFLISDITLVPMYFGKMGTKPHYVILNHVSYYLAQQLMAFSLMAFAYRW